MKIRLKKVIFNTVFFVVLSNFSISQNVGLVFATPRWAALDHIVERYNATRPWLDQQMKPLHTLPGFQFSLGSKSFNEKQGVGLEFLRFQYIGRTVEATGNGGSRELRASLSTLSVFGYQWFFVNKPKFALGVGAFPVELSIFKVKSKTNADEKFETLHRSFTFIGVPSNASSTFSLDLLAKGNAKGKIAPSIRFYYSLFWFIDDSMIFVNADLNPDTFTEHHQKQILRNSHGGVQLLLNIVNK
jgi:hypothetical protein